MRIEISAIRDAGKLDSERVVLKVTGKTDIGRYLLAMTRRLNDQGTVSNKLRYVFWVPDLQVEPGDFVVVYTKSGTTAKSQNRSGTATHSFYRGYDMPIWGSEGDIPIILEVGDWSTKMVEKD